MIPMAKLKFGTSNFELEYETASATGCQTFARKQSEYSLRPPQIMLWCSKLATILELSSSLTP